MKNFTLSLSLSLSLKFRNLAKSIETHCNVSLQRRAFFTILFLGLFFGLGIVKASAQTYYVDCNATNDLGAGTSEGAAWKTIAKVNGSTFLPDDNIFFKRGCTFREQLTVPSSGTNGHPIIFGAYPNNSDPKPVISGSVSKDNAGDWTSETAGGSSTLWTQDITNNADYEFRKHTYTSAFDNTWLATDSFSVTSTVAKLWKSGSPTGNVWMAIYADNAGVPGTLLGQSANVDVAGLSASTPGADATFTFSTPVALTSGALYHFVLDSSVVTSTSDYLNFQRNTAGPGSVFTHGLTRNVTTWGVDDAKVMYLKIYYTPALVYYWYASGSASPVVVARDGTALSQVATKAAVNSSGKWYQDSGNKRAYIYGMDATTNPTTGGHAFELGQRDYGIIGTGKSYVTVNGIDVKYTNSFSIIFSNSSNYVTITNCNAFSNGLNDLIDINNSTNGEVSHCTTSYAAGYGIKIVNQTNSNIFENNTSHSGFVTDDRAGITAFGTCSGNRIYQNKAHDSTNAGNTGVRGIDIDTIGDSGTNYVYQNEVWNNDGGGIAVISANNQQVYDNLSRDNQIVGGNPYPFGIKVRSSTGTLVYNNTLYNNRYAGIWGIVSGGTQTTGSLIKNNIIVMSATSRYGIVFDNTTNTADYNDIYGATGSNDPYGWAGTDYLTRALFYAGTTQGQHDLTSDSLFISTSTPDFHLQPTSPAINAGTPVGLTTDYEGNPVPSGLRPDIGAYEFQDTFVPTGGSFAINSNATATNSTAVTLNITCPTDAWTPIEMAYGDSADPSNWETCGNSKAWTLPAGDGTKTVHMRFRDGGHNLTSDMTDTITLDTSAPVITITNPNSTPAKTKTITASATESGTLAYAINTAGNDTCNDTLTFSAYTDLTFSSESDNGKKVCYRAQDALNNTAYSLSEALTGIDRTPPTSQASPAGGTYGTARNVTLSCEDALGCAIIYYTTDNSDPTTASAEYATPIEIDVTKTLKFFATDLAGNSEGINSELYTIDSSLPATEITSSPDAITQNTSATFAFSANLSGSTLECKLDDAEFFPCDSATTQSYTNLEDGEHEFTVRATHLGHVETNPSTYAWTVDTILPVIDSYTPIASYTNNDSPQFTFHTTEGGNVTYTNCPANNLTTATTGDNTITFTSLSDNTYANCQFQITDSADNFSELLIIPTFTIDTHNPDITNLTPNSATLPATTTSTTLTATTSELTFCKYSSDAGATWSAMQDFNATNSTTNTTLLTGLNAGQTYHYYITCHDRAGNVSTQGQSIFSLEAIPASAALTTKTKIKIGRTLNKFKDTIKLAKEHFQLKQTDPALANGTVKIYKNNKLWKTIKLDASGAWKKTLKLENDTTKTIKLKFYDALGMLLGTQTAKLKVDSEKPKFTKFITNNYTISKGQKLYWEVTDNQTIKKFKVYFNGHSFTVTPAHFTVPANTPAGKYLIKVRAYDAVGNTDFRESWVWVR